MQIVGTRWDGARMSLQVQSEEGTGTWRPEGGFQWQVGRRTCTGYFGDGWNPCPDQAPVGHEGQCLACFRGRGDPARRDDQPGCIFEPACQGVPERCVCSFGGAAEPVPHVVYCAFYGPLPKVGMTTARRVHTRLVEQGADAYFIASRCDDRQSARARERQVAFMHGLPEWRRHQEVLPQLTRPVDRDRVAAVARRWMERLDSDGALVHIDHPLAPLPSPPRRTAVEGGHAGAWRGAKGAYLFYEPESGRGMLDTGTSPVLALKRMDLMGRWIEAA